MKTDKLNPCEWGWFWPTIEWLADDCQCCAIVRALVLGAAAGFLIGGPLDWKVCLVVGVVLLAIGLVAAALRTPPKDEEESK